MLIIAAHHTSNWDLLFLVAAAWHLDLPINFLAKDSLFNPLLGPLMRGLGGLPVDRSEPHHLVDKLAAQITSEHQCALVVPPSGTRSYRDYWKSGFYRIAQAASIPVVCGYLDYSRREAGLGLSFDLTGNLTEDMDRIRDFYAPITPCHPPQAARIRLRDED